MRWFLLLIIALFFCGCSNEKQGDIEHELKPNLETNLTIEHEDSESNITIDVEFPPQPASD